jgi:hypothetical protein
MNNKGDEMYARKCILHETFGLASFLQKLLTFRPLESMRYFLDGLHQTDVNTFITFD